MAEEQTWGIEGSQWPVAGRSQRIRIYILAWKSWSKEVRKRQIGERGSCSFVKLESEDLWRKRGVVQETWCWEEVHWGKYTRWIVYLEVYASSSCAQHSVGHYKTSNLYSCLLSLKYCFFTSQKIFLCSNFVYLKIYQIAEYFFFIFDLLCSRVLIPNISHPLLPNVAIKFCRFPVSLHVQPKYISPSQGTLNISLSLLIDIELNVSTKKVRNNMARLIIITLQNQQNGEKS